MGTLRRAVCLLVLLLAALAGGHAALAGPTEAEQRVDAFLDETASLFPTNEADIVKALGQPKDRQSQPFSSPHDDSSYEVVTLVYDGLVISLYSMEDGQRQFFHQIQVTAGPTCFARKVCLGTSREKLSAALGQPEEMDERSWRYSDVSGYNELVFTFDAAGAIDSMTWTAEAD